MLLFYGTAKTCCLNASLEMAYGKLLLHQVQILGRGYMKGVKVLSPYGVVLEFGIGKKERQRKEFSRLSVAVQVSQLVYDYLNWVLC